MVETPGPKENADVDSSAKTDKLPGHFCVESIIVIMRAKSRAGSG
jgi:hypothetical protein